MPNNAIYIGPAPWAHDDSEGRARARPRIALGIVVALLLHGALYFLLPKPVQVDGTPNSGPLQVRLSPPAAAAPPKIAKVEPPQPSKPPPRRTIAAAPSNRPAPFVVPVEPPPDQQPSLPTKPIPADQPQTMAEFIARKQAQRAEADAAAARFNAAGRAAAGDQTSDERRAASLAGNLKSLSQQPDGTNGIFQIVNKGHRTAQFTFREWTTDASSSKRRLVEVDAGQGGDIEIAIVRKMIELIREHYQANFNWDSYRLGRVVTLSARKEDSAGLEQFLMREFSFGNVR